MNEINQENHIKADLTSMPFCLQGQNHYLLATVLPILMHIYVCCIYSALQVLVFDFGAEFYVWQGKAVTMEQRKQGMALARILWDKGYDYSQCAINPISPLRREFYFWCMHGLISFFHCLSCFTLLSHCHRYVWTHIVLHFI